MSQRGGAVLAHLRLADAPIASDLIPHGCASLILSMEPLESLRYLNFLSPDGAVVTAITPVQNIPDYPPLDALLDADPASCRGRAWSTGSGWRATRGRRARPTW